VPATKTDTIFCHFYDATVRPSPCHAFIQALLDNVGMREGGAAELGQGAPYNSNCQ